MNDDQAEPIVNELALRLQSVDPSALAGADAYWAAVVEQIWLGLL